MMHPTEIAAYTYRADHYCPADIVAEVCQREGSKGHGLSSVPEQALDLLARFAGIDREDERSFDSDDFPKVVFADQLEPGETCGRCHAEFDPGSGEQAAIDLALNDCQLWGNLPESARDFYRREAREF